MSEAASPSANLAADPFFAELKRVVVEKTGLAYYLDKDEELVRILSGRMIACGCEDAASYLLHISKPGFTAEQDELVSELTIGETYFFRHPEVFTALKKHVVPDMLMRNGVDRSLRVWSAGCSSGAEIYSIAILLKTLFARETANWRLALTGTDIDKKSLEQARSGLYQDWALRATPPEERAIYFEKRQAGWQLKDAFRGCVVFHHHNLIQDALPMPGLGLDGIDLILCRNVAIYFSRDQVQALMQRFLACLNEGGWLITGPAEFGMDRPPGYQAVNLDGLIVYRKEGGAAAASRKTLWTPPSLPLEPEIVQASALAPDSAALVETQEAPSKSDDDEAELLRLFQRGQWIAAAASARRVLAAEGISLETVFKAVQALVEIGDYATAERALKRLLFIDRKCQMAYYHLGLLLMCRGDEGMAAKAFRNAYDLASAAPPGQPVAGGEGLTAGKLAAMAKPRAFPRKPA